MAPVVNHFFNILYFLTLFYHLYLLWTVLQPVGDGEVILKNGLSTRSKRLGKQGRSMKLLQEILFQLRNFAQLVATAVSTVPKSSPESIASIYLIDSTRSSLSQGSSSSSRTGRRSKIVDATIHANGSLTMRGTSITLECVANGCQQRLLLENTISETCTSRIAEVGIDFLI